MLFIPSLLVHDHAAGELEISAVEHEEADEDESSTTHSCQSSPSTNISPAHQHRDERPAENTIIQSESEYIVCRFESLACAVTRMFMWCWKIFCGME